MFSLVYPPHKRKLLQLLSFPPPSLASTRLAWRVYIRQYCFEIFTEKLFATCGAQKYPTFLQTGIYLYSRSSPSSPTLTLVNTLSIFLFSLLLVFNCQFLVQLPNCLRIHFDLNYHLHFYSLQALSFCSNKSPTTSTKMVIKSNWWFTMLFFCFAFFQRLILLSLHNRVSPRNQLNAVPSALLRTFLLCSLKIRLLSSKRFVILIFQ